MRLLNGMQPLPPTPKICVDTIALAGLAIDVHICYAESANRMFK